MRLRIPRIDPHGFVAPTLKRAYLIDTQIQLRQQLRHIRVVFALLHRSFQHKNGIPNIACGHTVQRLGV